MSSHPVIQMTAPTPPSRWARVWGALRSAWTGPLTSRSPELARLWAGPPTSTGVVVNEHTALTYSAFWAGVTLIASDVASLPLILYKRLPNGGKTRMYATKLYELLHDEPNPEMSSIVFRETLQAHVLTWGNGYAEIERNGAGQVAALWPLTPDRVHPFREDRTNRLLYRVEQGPSRKDAIFDARDIFHVPGLGFNGTVGYSVVANARESIGLGLATERFGGTFFGNGSSFGGVFEHPAVMTEGAQKRFHEAIAARHQGVDRAHKFLIVEEGMKYQRLGIPPNDAQFIETRKFQIEEVARWFRLPPHKLGAMEHATFSNIEHQDLEYYKSCLRSWLERWEQEIRRKLIPPLERRIQFAQHLIDGQLRGDIQSRYAAYAVGRQWGWLSANRICEFENLDPLPAGGDVFLVPQNMAPADRLDEVITAQIKKAETPSPSPPGDKDEDDRDQQLTEANARVLRAETSLAVVQAALERAQAAAGDFDQTAEALAALRVTAAELQTRVDVLTPLVEEAKSDRDALVAQVSAATAARLVAEAEAARAQEDAERVRQAEAAAMAQVAAADAARDLAEQDRQAAQGRATDAEQRAQEAAGVAAEEAEARARAEAQVATGDVARQHAEHETQAALSLVTDAEQRAREAAAGRTVAEQETQEAILGRTAAETAAQDAAARLTRAQQDVTAADTARVAAESQAAVMAAERDAALEQVTAERMATVDRLTRVIGAHRALITDAMGRMIRRETEKGRRAQTTPEKLRTWLGTFYPVHADVCHTALLPVLRTHLAWQGSDADPETVTAALVAAHIDESVRQVRAVLETDPDDLPVSLETLWRRWETDRAERLADRILREAIDHVRHATT